MSQRKRRHLNCYLMKTEIYDYCDEIECCNHNHSLAGSNNCFTTIHRDNDSATICCSIYQFLKLSDLIESRTKMRRIV